MRDRIAEPLVFPDRVTRADLAGEEGFELRGPAAHHLARVLRARPGELVRLGDGAGASRGAEVAAVRGEAVLLRWVGGMLLDPAPSPRIALILAMIEGPDLCDAVEGATEAGVDDVILFRAGRSTRGVPERGGGTRTRLERICREACGQSRRTWIPTITSVSDIQDARARVDSLAFADPRAERRPALTSLGTTAGVAIGPEGGWTDAECSIMEASGATPLWLGPTVFRARTAAVVGVHRLVMVRARARD